MNFVILLRRAGAASNPIWVGINEISRRADVFGRTSDNDIPTEKLLLVTGLVENNSKMLFFLR